MRKNLFEYLPPVLQQVLDFRHIMQAEQPELDKLFLASEEVYDNQFCEIARLSGVERYEQILGITPKASETLQDRRFRILARFNERLPYTYRMLESMLETLCGAGGYALELNAREYTLSVQIALASKAMYGDVDDMLKRVVPANLVISVSLKYNQHETLAAFTHAQLAAYTHDQLRNEVL